MWGEATRRRLLRRAGAMKNGRCRMHGGKSTGSRTPEGLEPRARPAGAMDSIRPEGEETKLCVGRRTRFHPSIYTEAAHSHLTPWYCTPEAGDFAPS
jgi:hypothetical protein